MSTTVNLQMPDEVYHRADRLAHLVGRSVDDILGMAIELALSPLTPPSELPLAVEHLSDEEVVALTERRMNHAQDQRLSELLHRQQAGMLSADERLELATLLQIYQEGLVRQAQAMRETVRRGLREPLGA